MELKEPSHVENSYMPKFIDDYGTASRLSSTYSNMPAQNYSKTLSDKKELNLSYNKITSLEKIADFNHLEVLKICHNSLGDSQMKYLQFLINLRVLDVSENRIRSISFIHLIQNLTNLEELHSSNNEFTEWTMPYSFPNLKILTLDHNKISSITFSTPLISLIKLSCKENLLRSIQGIENAENLIELNINNNLLQILPNEIVQLRSLQTLYCKSNSISTIYQINTLEILDCSYNILITLPDMRNLTEIDASHNRLEKLCDFYSLLSGDFSYNKLGSLVGLRNCVNLGYLNVSYNGIESLDQVIEDLKKCKLRILDVKGVSLGHDGVKRLLGVFPELAEINQEVVQGNVGVKENSRFMGSGYWDNLSKSRLFPSCRSSLAYDKPTPVKVNQTYNSIFSDFKNSKSAISPILAHRYEEPKQELTGRFSTESLLEIPKNKSATTKAKASILHNQSFECSQNFSEILEVDDNPRENPKKIRKNSANESQRTSEAVKKPCHRRACKKHRNTDSLQGNSSRNLNKSDIISTRTQRHSSTRNQKLDLFPDSQFQNHEKNKENYNETRLKRHQAKNSSVYTDINDKKVPLPCENDIKISTLPPKVLNMTHIFTYSRTPPRPILPTEKNVTFVNQINNNSYEFSLISELFNQEGYKIAMAKKTFTYSLHNRNEKLVTSNRLSRTPDNLLLFFHSNYKTLQTIANDCRGFEAVYEDKDIGKMTFANSVTGCTMNLLEQNTIMLALLDPGRVLSQDNKVFSVTSLRAVIPVYIIDYY